MAVVVPLAAGAAPAFASDHVWSWGNGNWGSLGDGVSTVVEGSEVVVIPAGVCAMGVEGPCPSGPFLEDVTSMSAGGAHGLALLDNGTVVAWGENELGQLGDGTNVGPSTCGRKGRVEVERVETEPCSPTPVTVSGLSGVSAIAAATGGSHSLALLNSGTVMAWGADGEGQLGDGSTEGSDVPVEVSGLTGVTAIAAGEASSLALLGDGAVMSWGTNGGGQLGVGGREGLEGLAYSDVPVQVCTVGFYPELLCRSGPFLSGARAVSAGSAYELAVLETSTVGWGDDCYGGDSPCEPTELAEATAVHFGSVSAPSFTVHSESSITAVTPPEATGIVPVTVTTPQGTSEVVNGIFLHYIAAFPQPTIKRLVPDKGPAAGGTSVFITGSGLYGGSIAVHFGSTSATSVTVKSPSRAPASRRGWRRRASSSAPRWPRRSNAARRRLARWSLPWPPRQGPWT